MRRREASINDLQINERERRIFGPDQSQNAERSFRSVSPRGHIAIPDAWRDTTRGHQVVAPPGSGQSATSYG